MSVFTWSHHSTKATTWWMVTIAVAWLSAVVYGAESGVFTRLYQPLIGAIVAATIVLPTLWYFLSPRVQKVVEAIGHKRIMIMHTWRVPAALMFFWYGLRGELPPVFWVLAGTGDFVAGLYAGYLSVKPESAKRYLSFHRFGFADFVVAVGTGLTHTLVSDPRMAPIAVLPMALIPLFGVGISGVSHLVAFDMLRRRVGFTSKQTGVATVDQAIFLGPVT